MRRVGIPVMGLACSAGDGLALERGLRRLPGVVRAYVNPVTDAVYLEVDAAVFDPSEAARVIEALGARDAWARTAASR